MDELERRRFEERLAGRSAQSRDKERFVAELLHKYTQGQEPSAQDSRGAHAAEDAIADTAPKGLDPTTRMEMERIFGEDLGDVRVHTGEYAQEIADCADARAFTVNERDVFFGGGEFQPGSAEGKALLAHELSHVVERRQGVFPSLRNAAVASHSEASAERAEHLVLALEESSAKEAETILNVGAEEETAEESGGMSLAAKKRWLVEHALKQLRQSERRQSERMGLF